VFDTEAGEGALVVDLDGTLTPVDTLHELWLLEFKRRPLKALALLSSAFSSRATFKRVLAENHIDGLENLPLAPDIVDIIQDARNNGRTTILATGASEVVATALAHKTGLFDDVHSSRGDVNLTGKRKAHHLVERFGRRGFTYIGNSVQDVPVWAEAHTAIVVSPSTRLVRKAATVCDSVTHVDPRRSTIKTWIKALRVHQWTKNFLLFLPLLASHQLGQVRLWIDNILAFLLFSLLASATYIINDILDLAADRRHATKRERPFAAGILTVKSGVLVSGFLGLLVLFGCVVWLPPLLPWLGVYALLTLTYSFALKMLAILDCMTLSLLYVIRVLAGAATAGLTNSFWLIGFALFFFFGMALAKRYSEVQRYTQASRSLPGRGYIHSDGQLVLSLGVTSSQASVLLAALYLNSPEVALRYDKPAILWAILPILMLWIGYLWLTAHRGKLNDDPIVFAIQDPWSRLAAASLTITFVVAALGIS